MGLDVHAIAQQAEGRIVRTKWCSNHQGSASIEAGSLVRRGKVTRWICFGCQTKAHQRRSELGRSIGSQHANPVTSVCA